MTKLCFYTKTYFSWEARLSCGGWRPTAGTGESCQLYLCSDPQGSIFRDGGEEGKACDAGRHYQDKNKCSDPSQSKPVQHLARGETETNK